MLTNKAALLDDLGRYEEALTLYDRVLSLEPKLATAGSHRGNTPGHLNRLDEAPTSVDQALVFDPDFLSAWSLKGGILIDL
ncbi:MAG TPA: tetratricopeptide repeat protein [Ktedonobacterales bacterium]|nr:tetratricopeptide repeat protein [Ktedonobacterales bacterium]